MIYRYTYKITCLFGRWKGKFYFGQHSTNNLNDGYFASGIKINRYKNKYGLENCKREILAFYNSKEELDKAEYELIHPWLNNPNCLNLKEGGTGGGIKGLSPWNKGLKGVQEAWNKGLYGVSEVTSNKMKAAWKYRKPDSEETRLKKSKSAQNRKPDSEETRLKKSKNAKNNKYSADHKWMNNGIDIIYPHISECNYWLKMGYQYGRKKSTILNKNK